MRKKSALRPDTTLVEADEPEEELYVWSLPACCLRSLKESVLAEPGERRLLELRCSCGKRWRVTSSLDERILARFVARGEAQVGGSHPAA